MLYQPLATDDMEQFLEENAHSENKIVEKILKLPHISGHYSLLNLKLMLNSLRKYNMTHREAYRCTVSDREFHDTKHYYVIVESLW